MIFEAEATTPGTRVPGVWEENETTDPTGTDSGATDGSNGATKPLAAEFIDSSLFITAEPYTAKFCRAKSLATNPEGEYIVFFYCIMKAVPTDLVALHSKAASVILLAELLPLLGLTADD